MLRSLVVMTQNAWGGAPVWRRRRERLAQSIAEHAPDVVGLQEVHADAPSGEDSQAHELAALAGDYRAIFAAGRVTERGHAEGVALLVRKSLEIVDHDVRKLSVDPNDLLDRPHQRVVLRAGLRDEGSTVDALVTHLSLSKAARKRTLHEVVAFAARAPCSALMGDFNATPGEGSLGALRAAGWVDAWSTVHGGVAGGTWPSPSPLRRIDYTWVRAQAPWRVARCLRTAPAGSDHVGLVTELVRDDAL